MQHLIHTMMLEDDIPLLYTPLLHPRPPSPLPAPPDNDPVTLYIAQPSSLDHSDLEWHIPLPCESHEQEQHSHTGDHTP